MGVVLLGLPQMVTQYGYPVLLGVALIAAAGTPIPLTSLLLALGAVSGARGGPNFTLLVVFGTLGSVAGDVIDYGAGRFGGAPLLAWLASHRRLQGGRLERARHFLERRGGLAIFFTRFAFTAVASPISVLVGASRLKPLIFLAWDFAGELVYVLSMLLLGRVFGGDLAEDGAFGTVLALVTILGVVVPLLAVGIRWLLTIRSRRLRPPARALPGDTAGMDDLPASVGLPIR
ncbi:MAG TPA: DedA family protein [Ktedonobacterales bacterium]|nr:DedA family protein [Ktedonobacterales bacterium]